MEKKINIKNLIIKTFILLTTIITAFLVSLFLNHFISNNYREASQLVKHQHQQRSTLIPQLVFDSSQSGTLNNDSVNNNTYYYDFTIVIQNQNNDLFYIANSQQYSLSLVVNYTDLASVNIVVNGSRILSFDDMIYSFVVDITTSSSLNTYVQFTSNDSSLVGAVVNFQLIAVEKQDDASYDSGYADGFDIGKTQGYDIGYLEGYDLGIIEGGNINSVEWLKNTFNAVASILVIEPFPGLSFATIIAIPLITTVVQFILGWFI